MRCLIAAMMFVFLAGTSAQAADTSAGAAKAEPCKACHGDAGISAIENTPSLAGQPDLYNQWQLIFFKSGARKNDIMGPLSEQLSNQDIRDLGAYFASLKPPAKSEADSDPKLIEAGKTIAAEAKCPVCHLNTYAGDKATARIAGQREDYLAKSLRDYKNGLRTGGGMAAMANVATSLTEEQITALAHYLSRL